MNLSAETIDRVAKFLPLLASDRDGEVLAAARALTKALEREKADLHDVVRLISSPSKQGEAYGSNSWADVLRAAAAARERAEAERARVEEERKKAEEVRWAAYWDEQHRKAAARLAEAIAEFGPEEEAFAETPEETRLATGLVAFPGTVLEQVAGWQFRQDLATRRRRYDDSFENSEIVSDRVDGLEQCITSTPARTWADLDARLAWLKNCLATGWRTTFTEDDIRQYEVLTQDLARLRGFAGSPSRRRGLHPTTDQLNLF